MSSPEQHPISRNPALQELQLAQFAAELESHPVNQKIVALARLQLLPLGDLLGRYCEIDATLAVGKSMDRPVDTRFVYEHGLMFGGRAKAIGYANDTTMSSVFIDFRDPVILVDAEMIDEDVERALYDVAAPSISIVRTPILAIRGCSIDRNPLNALG